MSVRICLNVSPDILLIIAAFTKALEICSAEVAEVPGDNAANQFIVCVLNTFEEMVSGGK